MKKSDPGSKREQRLLFLLPSVAVLVVYAFLIALPKQRQLSDLVSTYESTKARAIDKQIAEQSLQDLLRAKDGLERLRERLTTARSTMKQTSQNWRSPGELLATIQQLTEMLDQYELSILSQNNEPDPSISNYVKSLTEKINSESPNAPPIQFWKIEVEGKYSDIQSFLSSIDLDSMKTFPLTLSMSLPETGSATPKWTIIFVV